MKKPFGFLLHRVYQIRDDAAGATAIEYGLLCALIGIAIIGALSNLGDTVSVAFNNFATMLNDSYGITTWDTSGTMTIDGQEVTYNYETSVNANGSQTFDNSWTYSDGSVWENTGTLSYNGGAIGGNQWTETATQTDDGQFNNSYVQTNTGGMGSNTGYAGTVDQTNAQGQTQDWTYSQTYDGNNTYTETDTGTTFNGQSFNNVNTDVIQSQNTSSNTGSYR